jgi:hypothetical protein
MLHSGMLPKPFPKRVGDARPVDAGPPGKSGTFSNRDQRLCWIGRQNFGKPKGRFQILLTERHFIWLCVRCEEMGVPKEDLVFGALLEWVYQPGRTELPNASFSRLVFVALEEFIRRHRSEFLPVPML